MFGYFLITVSCSIILEHSVILLSKNHYIVHAIIGSTMINFVFSTINFIIYFKNLNLDFFISLILLTLVYSHSIVPGGLEVMSNKTLFIPLTSLIILLLVSARNSFLK